MTVELLEIPDDTQALPRWLESQLVGTDLAALVAQLEAVHGASTAGATSLDEVLGGNRASVLRDGLGGLKSDQLRKLLVNPRLLLDLQEALLLEGGPYWTRQAQSGPQNQENLTQGRRRMERFLASETAAPAVVPLKATLLLVAPRRLNRSGHRRGRVDRRFALPRNRWPADWRRTTCRRLGLGQARRTAGKGDAGRVSEQSGERSQRVVQQEAR